MNFIAVEHLCIMDPLSLRVKCELVSCCDFKYLIYHSNTGLKTNLREGREKTDRVGWGGEERMPWETSLYRPFLKTDLRQ
jgi:hypothetical protein